MASGQDVPDLSGATLSRGEGCVAVKSNVMDTAAVESVFASAMSYKDQGNQRMRERDFAGAALFYTTGVGLMEFTKLLKTSPHAQEVYEALLSNAIQAHDKANELNMALKTARKLLQANPNHIKGLFRHGRVLRRLSRFSEALAAFGKAMELDGAA
ncbi:unnamed protein product [Vitrella brassicaformis CCMP3155]|uniref:Uncharacterized protein n=1 Tax=Vitrella brassicaformis (strain CCMP3155) TaxID=1169540 RepID=A0A0G4GGP9_VITBC|nr:unnamed protein product [Vitrella brassicaformis CCMP3155]|eukprot:CEM28614.1 unnamed protein product [Vitrella brassicaformis CCMP3155]